MQVDWLSGYVIHKIKYRETSFLVDFFTLELGKIRVVAKGVRTHKSQKSSLLQPLQSLRFQISGKSELKNLKTIEPQLAAISLTGQSLFCSFYLNELINRVMPSGLVSDSLFHAYELALSQLSKESDIEPILRGFEFALLNELGVMPDLEYDALSGQPIAAEKSYILSQEDGLIESVENSRHVILAGEGLLAVRQGIDNSLARITAKKLCRIAIKPFLGGKPLKSRELFTTNKG